MIHIHSTETQYVCWNNILYTGRNSVYTSNNTYIASVYDPKTKRHPTSLCHSWNMLRSEAVPGTSWRSRSSRGTGLTYERCKPEKWGSGFKSEKLGFTRIYKAHGCLSNKHCYSVNKNAVRAAKMLVAPVELKACVLTIDMETWPGKFLTP